MCVAAAVWLWLEYSHAWDVVPKDISHTGVETYLPEHPFVGKYVRLRGKLRPGEPPGIRLADPRANGLDHVPVAVRGFENGGEIALVCLPERCGRPEGEEADFDGRVVIMVVMPAIGGEVEVDDYLVLVVDTTRSRFTGASIAGLVVGAWGVFIFAAAFLHWHKRRSLCREDEAAATSS